MIKIYYTVSGVNTIDTFSDNKRGKEKLALLDDMEEEFGVKVNRVDIDGKLMLYDSLEYTIAMERI